MSMSGGRFLVVASEAITVGDKTITLPGIGSYLAQATAEKNLAAVGWVVLAMTAVIILYDDAPATGRLGRQVPFRTDRRSDHTRFLVSRFAAAQSPPPNRGHPGKPFASQARAAAPRPV